MMTGARDLRMDASASCGRDRQRPFGVGVGICRQRQQRRPVDRVEELPTAGAHRAAGRQVLRQRSPLTAGAQDVASPASPPGGNATFPRESAAAISPWRCARMRFAAEVSRCIEYGTGVESGP